MNAPFEGIDSHSLESGAEGADALTLQLQI